MEGHRSRRLRQMPTIWINCVGYDRSATTLRGKATARCDPPPARVGGGWSNSCKGMIFQRHMGLRAELGRRCESGNMLRLFPLATRFLPLRVSAYPPFPMYFDAVVDFPAYLVVSIFGSPNAENENPRFQEGPNLCSMAERVRAIISTHQDH